MITMKLLRFLLAPALLAAIIDLTEAELVIYPVGDVTSVNEGEGLMLTCEHSEEGRTSTELSMRWLDKGNQPILEESGLRFIMHTNLGVKLIFTSISADHDGYYTCVANVDGTQQQATKRIRVTKHIELLSPPQQAIKNGTDSRVWCRFTPTTDEKNLNWYQRGRGATLKQLDAERFVPGVETNPGEEGNYLLIRNANLADTNVYVCSLEFKATGETKNFDISVIVTVPPKIMPIHLEPPIPKQGDRLVMSCKADGVPAPTYMFYKGSKALSEDRTTDGQLIIDPVAAKDEGEYRCNAENVGGSQDETTILDVKILPTFEDTDNVTDQEGASVRLPCIALGEPVPMMVWRRKGSQVYFLNQQNSKTDIYVEEVTDDPIRDGDTVNYRRTLFLVIPELKSEHAGEYVCKADNQYGVKERTFKIDVQYKPNFKDQKVSVFYGWENSKTNLTCISNGNPEPVISWHKGDQNLADQSDYLIVMANSGVATRAISYLVPTVDSTNMGTIFGEYKCEAANRFGSSSQTLIFQRAVVPDVASVSVISSKATEMILGIAPPSNDGGQPVIRYIVKYGPIDSSQDPEILKINRFPDDSSTQVTLQDLTPKTKYSIKVYAVNNVGEGKEKNIMESTKDFSRPDPVVILSDHQGLLGNVYELTWDIPMTGGVPITNYVIQYTEALEVDTSSEPWKGVRVSDKWKTVNVEGEETTRYTLKGLKQEQYYQVKIEAVNRIEASDSTTFVFRTGRGGEKTGDEGEPSLGPAGIVVLIIVLLLLLALAVDAAFYKTKQCGLIWTISRMLGRKDEGPVGASKSPEDGDEAAAKLLGKEKDDAVHTEHEVDGRAPDTSAQEASEVDGQPPGESKQELEPEDKEEKPAIAVGVEEQAPAKEAEAPAKEPAGEAAKEVETKPPATEEADQTAKA